MEDEDYICPFCGNTVTLFESDWRRPRTLQCGACFNRFYYSDDDRADDDYWY